MARKFNDLTSKRFGSLVVIRRVSQQYNGRETWFLCVCDCGEQRTIRGRSLVSGGTKSCGCLRQTNTKILISKKFGDLVVVGQAPLKANKSNKRQSMVRCDCSCGKKVTVAVSNLKLGVTKSCGCLREKNAKRLFTKHGYSINEATEYRTWKSIKKRCNNQKEKNYYRYGGRGIKVCDRWANDFTAFLADMGPKPTPKHSIDRIDNDGNYELSNCRWVTSSEQQRNKRNNHKLTFKGETKTLVEWSEEIGVSFGMLSRRIGLGWTTEEALTIPKGQKRNALMETFNGKTQSLNDWSNELGVSFNTLYSRLRCGWSVEKTLATSIRPRKI